MRHSDSSPPIPPRFVAFARRYHPSTCGSLRRTPGATSTASGVVSRCPRPGGLYDGADEASRGPGKPTRTHATRSDPGEVAASPASETRRDDLPSNHREECRGRRSREWVDRCRLNLAPNDPQLDASRPRPGWAKATVLDVRPTESPLTCLPRVRAELRSRLVTNASLQPEQVATCQSLTRTEVATTR